MGKGAPSRRWGGLPEWHAIIISWKKQAAVQIM
jgi:hypothetical protein